MIPDGWAWRALGDVVSILAGYAFPSTQFTNDCAAGLPLVRIRDLHTQQPSIFIQGDYPAGFVIRPGDILVGMDGDFEASRWRAGAALLNQRVCKLWPSRAGLIAHEFLYYRVGSELGAIHASVGRTTVKHLSTKHLSVRQVLLPPLPEQRKIAAILSSVDEAIDKTRAVIDQLGVVKKGMMHELITKGLPGRHTRFKKTEIGMVPESWEVAPLGDVISDGPTNGLYKPAHLIGRGVLIAGLTAIEDSNLCWTACRRAELEPTEEERFGLRSDDILVTRVYARIDGIGRFIVVPAPPETAVYESNMMRIRVASERTLPDFVAIHMRLDDSRKEIERRATLGAQASINNAGIRALPLRLPPLDEQVGIVDAVEGVSERIGLEIGCLRELNTVKSALMSVLLTGEVRVTPDEDTA